MGTWGTGTFDNDTACDWSFGLEETNDLSLVREAFAHVADTSDSLDSDVACEGLAACEVVARLLGRSGVRDAYTEPVDDWVQANPQTPDAATIASALAMIDRVLTEPSEVVDLWAESDANGEWKKAVAELRTRVAG